MPTRKESSPKEKNEAGKSSGKAESVTCKHCRYERPAQGKQCPICGYPWPWMK